MSRFLKVLLPVLALLFLIYNYLPLLGLTPRDLLPFDLPWQEEEGSFYQEETGNEAASKAAGYKEAAGQKEEQDAAGEEAPSFSQATLVAVGDIMVHQTQFVEAYEEEKGSYNFSPSFQLAAPYLQSAHLAVGNLETTLAGRERGYTAYPRFNSPDEIAFALAEAGFDLLCTANNHSLDSGEEGLYRTLDIIEEAGMQGFGTARSRQERDTPLLVEVEEITLAFLAYTYGTNAIPLPDGKDYVVNLIDEELIAGDIAQSRKEGADLVIVYMHWGHEYHAEPSQEQKRLAGVIAEAGADIILGSHPHVIQPMEYITVEEEDGSSREVFVVYSLGNFISNQHKIPGSIPTGDVKYGMMLRLNLEKDLLAGEAYLEEVDYMITWVNRSWRHRLLPLYRAVEADPQKFNMSANTRARLEEDWQRLQQRLQGFAPAFTLSP